MFLLLIIVVLVIIYSNTKKKNENKVLDQSNNEDLISVNSIQENESSDEYIGSILKEYKVAGVTYKNENGKDIQSEIKKILNEYVKAEDITKDDMYLGYSNSEIKEYDLEVSQFEDIDFEAKIEEDTFDNKPCIKVYFKRVNTEKYTHVGYIQERYNQIKDVLDIMHNKQIIKIYLNVVGGKIKECKVEEDDEYNEHYYVETTTLDYGLRLFIKYQNTNETE